MAVGGARTNQELREGRGLRRRGQGRGGDSMGGERGGAWGLGGTEAGPRGGRCERGSPEIEMVGSSISISGVKLFFFFLTCMIP